MNIYANYQMNILFMVLIMIKPNSYLTAKAIFALDEEAPEYDPSFEI